MFKTTLIISDFIFRCFGAKFQMFTVNCQKCNPDSRKKLRGLEDQGANCTLISLITVEVGINVEGVQKLQNQ